VGQVTRMPGKRHISSFQCLNLKECHSYDLGLGKTTVKIEFIELELEGISNLEKNMDQW
jgi:hypothetical protein